MENYWKGNRPLFDIIDSFLSVSEFVHALGEPGIDEDEEDDEEDLQSPLF